MATSATKHGDSEAAPPKNKKKGLIIAIAAVVLLAGGGGAAWHFMAPKDHGEKKEEHKAPPVFVVLEPLTVNLQRGEDGDQYLQVSMTTQVGDQAQADMMKLYMPQIRSRLLLLLSGKRAADISTPEGKKKLADDILEKIRQPYSVTGPTQIALDVFFTSFVIQ
jgi:flagellar FliL protein